MHTTGAAELKIDVESPSSDDGHQVPRVKAACDSRATGRLLQSLRQMSSDEMAVAVASISAPVPPLAFGESPGAGPVVLSRRHEFAHGRSCARQALAMFGCQAVAIPVGQGRRPIWPAGYVGSISHCRRFALAVVSSIRSHVGIGIDVEGVGAIDSGGLLDLIFSTAERRALPTSNHFDVPTVGFSAKEAAFKSLAASEQIGLEFTDIAVHFRLDERRFYATFPNGRRVRGLFAQTEGVVLTLASRRQRSQAGAGKGMNSGTA